MRVTDSHTSCRKLWIKRCKLIALVPLTKNSSQRAESWTPSRQIPRKNSNFSYVKPSDYDRNAYWRKWNWTKLTSANWEEWAQWSAAILNKFASKNGRYTATKKWLILDDMRKLNCRKYPRVNNKNLPLRKPLLQLHRNESPPMKSITTKQS